MMATGKWDFDHGPVNTLAASLKELGIESGYLEVPAAHDWECWQLIYAYAAEHFFFKAHPFTDVADDAWYSDAVAYRRAERDRGCRLSAGRFA